MNELLQPGQAVRSKSGQPCKVVSFLGSGGQGEVYEVEWGSKAFALKWYYQPSATAAQYAALQALIAQGRPSDKFLWPEDLAEADGVPGYGYLMPLRPARYKSLNDFVAGRIHPTSLALIVAALELCKAFRSLHTSGLCYRDISFGNAFFDIATGDVLVCDNDNVGTNRGATAGVLGTPDFMAPEIVRREATPSNKSDLYSLAVLLFYIFCLGHPLVGRKVLNIRCWDAAARELLFGKEPVFIFDPADPSNAAVDLSVDPTGEAGGTAKVYWAIYPQVLRDTFTKAFTSGVRDADSRVTELEWQDTLATLRDSIVRCACDTPNYYDLVALKATGGVAKNCWSCGKPVTLPYRIRIGKAVVMLNADSKLYPHHMNDGRAFDFSTPVAEVVRHPTDQNIWGLKNLTDRKWVATLGGDLRDVEPGRSVPLGREVTVNFGQIEAVIRA